MRNGFSLVELSVVLVILGLLVGGVLSGQSLIRSSELRTVTTEYQRYSATVQMFRDKYFAVPGDFNNAVAFWGAATVNGDGFGTLSIASGLGLTGEIFQFWNQLALAGLIEGTYTGLAGSNAGWTGGDSVPGTNVPKSKMNNGAWGVGTDLNNAGSTQHYVAIYGNLFTFGAKSVGTIPDTALLKPEEAWNIDTKLDDGQPGAGRIIAQYWNNACATASSNTDYAKPYNLAVNTPQCALRFTKAF